MSGHGEIGSAMPEAEGEDIERQVMAFLVLSSIRLRLKANA